MSLSSNITTQHRDISLASLPVGERQLLLKNIFIEHSRFREAWESIRRAHYPVVGGIPDFGSLSVMAGESRAGKSFVAERYVKDHPPIMTDSGMLFPVIRVDVPIDGQRALLESIAEALDLKFSLRINNQALLSMILGAAASQKVELILFDEVQTILSLETPKLVAFARHLFRKLLNMKTLNIICIGLEQTYTFMAADPQLTGRGGLPCEFVRPYSWESADEQKLFRLLCDEFDKRLPFNQRSNFKSVWFAQRLYHATKGNIGRLSDIIFSAGCLAINDAADSIEVRHFVEVYDRRKSRQVEFNPFVHDLALAPKAEPESTKLSGVSPRELFSKKRRAHEHA